VSGRPELVLLDLDGTLVDSAPDLTGALNATLLELDHAPQPEARVRRWIGSGGRPLLRQALAAANGAAPDERLVDSAYERFLGHYAAQLDRHSRLYPQVRETLDALHQRDLRLGCVTNKPQRFTEPLLRSLGLDHDFAVVVCGDTLAVMKPDPAPLLHAARQCGVGAAASVMVGDTLADISAARAARCRAFWVSYGYSHGQDIAAAKPDAVLHSLAELAHTL